MKNDFNRVAKSYQKLSQLVFGSALINAQKYNLPHLEDGDTILWIGGGDGELFRHFPTDLHLNIHYVELSERMILLSKSKVSDFQVKFYQCDLMMHEGKYDVVISNFFLDCFNQKSLEIVIRKLKELMKHDGRLMVTDFTPPKSLNDRFLIWCMHRFFGFMSNLESGSLLPIHKILEQEGFNTESYIEHKRPNVFSAIYSLPDQ